MVLVFPRVTICIIPILIFLYQQLTECILGDTATNLGTAMDELMRHQPTLRQDAMTAIIKVQSPSLKYLTYFLT